MGRVTYDTFFTTGALWEVAKQAHCRAASGEAEDARRRDALVAILFSAATLESFMSQAIDAAKHWSHLYPKIDVFARFMGELEGRETGSALKTKYYMARWIICGTPFDQGKQPYQDFDLLIELRNALTHLKPDRVASTKTRNLLSRLKSRNLIPASLKPKYDPDAPEDRTVWIHYVSTTTVAKWACNTAAVMIGAFWRDAPEEEIRIFFQVQANAGHYSPLGDA